MDASASFRTLPRRREASREKPSRQPALEGIATIIYSNLLPVELLAFSSDASIPIIDY